MTTPVCKSISSRACRDLSDGCVDWAKGGECKNNPDFMLGTDFAEPQCAKSCQVCILCGPCVLLYREHQAIPLACMHSNRCWSEWPFWNTPLAPFACALGNSAQKRVR